ncbi:hypothetical protein BZG36_03801 [Bifiguratus adelaidae]|uniref:Phosphatidate phosphatase APP1 catalytic domain-containing protein n=1 Tax=Bifiguratus adelaidae TaxID=1938954 RepID=A0A261XX15_9FUNG|nr:hypothetical protein BZG36_03801 [Bifiguratus adelaidae]
MAYLSGKLSRGSQKARLLYKSLHQDIDIARISHSPGLGAERGLGTTISPSSSSESLPEPEDEVDEANAALAQATGLRKQCLLFPTYAFQSKDEAGIARYAAGITKNTDPSISAMLEERMQYFLAKNASNQQLQVEIVGLTQNYHMEIEGEDPEGTQHSNAHQAKLSNGGDALSDLGKDPQAKQTSASHIRPVAFRTDSSSSLNSLNQSSIQQGNTFYTVDSGHFRGELDIASDIIDRWMQEERDKEEKMTYPRLLKIKTAPQALQRQLDAESKLLDPTFGMVNLVEPVGLSIISDIDDTIKDTKVLGGMRSVFNSTFLQEAREVEGMSALYTEWYKKGASFHYVSNSPFQLLPMLQTFFRNSSFPPGSAHLKLYSGIFSALYQEQGKAKRESILGLFKDFPNRKFVLIGDSGQIDLEIYTRLAREFPEKIVRIFIRDVTSLNQYEKERQKEVESLKESMRSSTFPAEFQSDKKSSLGPRSSSLPNMNIQSVLSDHGKQPPSDGLGKPNQEKEDNRNNKSTPHPLAQSMGIHDANVKANSDPALLGDHQTASSLLKPPRHPDQKRIQPTRHDSTSSRTRIELFQERVAKAKESLPGDLIVIFTEDLNGLSGGAGKGLAALSEDIVVQEQ